MQRNKEALDCNIAVVHPTLPHEPNSLPHLLCTLALEVVQERIVKRGDTATRADSKNGSQQEDCAGAGTEHSRCQYAGHIGISYSSIWRILHANDTYQYHIQRMQLLQQGDFVPGLAFARWYLQMCIGDPRSQPLFCSPMRRPPSERECITHITPLYGRRGTHMQQVRGQPGNGFQ